MLLAACLGLLGCSDGGGGGAGADAGPSSNDAGADAGADAGPPLVWTEVESDTGLMITDLWMAPDGTGLATTDYAALTYGYVQRFDGTSWTTLGNSGEFCGLFGVWGSSGDDAWFAGGDGYAGSGLRVLGHVDGTPSATPTTSFGPKWFAAVDGSAGDDVWVLASAAPSLRWNGAAWVEQAISGDNLYVAARDDVWVTAPGFNRSEVWHYTAAVGWDDVVVAGLDGNVTAMHGSSSHDLWLATSSALFHWNGSTWSSYGLPAGATTQLRGLWVDGPTEAWAVGTGGVVLRWDGGGWRTVRNESGANSLLAVTRDASGRIWAAGVGGTMIVTTP